ncbi:MAG: hypothetical protein GOVbin1709_29 [Prokaryotic dsDNA virus sp.]|nr:MAG: hypothetical protein GOVbin1709_29 [Prokaryotic dsDNA virus sp.]|tara:strand:+ start:3019 stop:3567 length:549 start_codon:yes stop_codon:yes gene_type:complete
MDLFDLRDFKVTISPKALIVPEFKALWDRDESKNKSTALSELAYVYYLSDFKSPYLLSLDISVVKHTVAKDFMKDENYKPDDLVEEAIKKYKSLQETPSMRLLNSSLVTVSKLTDYLESVDLDERDDKNKPIYKPSDITNSLKSIGGIVESLTKVRDQVEKEITQAGALRGQRKKGNREDPR